MPTEERRNVYRLSVSGSPCTVRARFGECYAVGMALDVSAEGVGATFRTDTDNRLPNVGDVGEVTIIADWCMEPISIEARAIRRADGDGVCVFGFEFLALPADIEPDLFGIFNRRSAVRVRPHLDVHIGVTVSCEDGEIGGELRDISRTGIAVDADIETQEVLGDATSVDIALPIRIDGERLRVPAVIRNRRCTGERTVTYGIAFRIPHDEVVVTSVIDEYVRQLAGASAPMLFH